MRNRTPRSRSLHTDAKRVSGDEPYRIATIPRSIRGERIAEMLTAMEFEALLKIDVKTIYTYVQKGLIPYVRIQSNLRFIRKEILNWIDEQSFLPDSTHRERFRG